MKERKEGRKEGTKDSMRQVPLYGGATMEQRPLTDVVRSSIGVGWNSLIRLYVIRGRPWSFYLCHVLHKCTKDMCRLLGKLWLRAAICTTAVGRTISGNPRKIQRLAPADNREEK